MIIKYPTYINGNITYPTIGVWDVVKQKLKTEGCLNAKYIGKITTGTRVWRKAGSDWNGAISVAFSPDGKYLAVASLYADAADAVEVMNAVDGSRIWRKAGSDWNGAISVAFSPDGKYLAVDAVEVMNAVDGSRIWRKAGSDWDGAISVAFSPDGKYLAVASWNADAVEVMI